MANTEPPNNHTGPRPWVRRRRPAISCALCRRKKIRCNRQKPCNNCIRSQNLGACVYDTPHSARRHDGRLDSEHVPHLGETANPASFASPLSDQSPAAPSRTQPTSTPGTQTCRQDAQWMRNRIRELEDQLSKLSPPGAVHSSVSPSASTIEHTSSSLGGNLDIHLDSRLVSPHGVIPRSVSHKKRLFGQTHWINNVVHLRDLIQTIEPCIRSERSTVLMGIQRCKALARAIKSQRAPLWPCAPTPDLPAKDVASNLVSRYFGTMESVYRVIHVPSFMRDFDAIWTSSLPPDPAFLVLLKLVLAIGAATYNENFTLRDSATRWIYEAQTWISVPNPKALFDLQAFQIHALLTIAKDVVDIGGDLTWVSVGSLLRTAVYMGLHRDPMFLPKNTIYVVEMRRRLWNTTLELCLQSSLTAGAPPFISITDFDTEYPRNFDDEQLLEDDPVLKPDTEWTQSSISRALRGTFYCRLATAKFLNDHSTAAAPDEFGIINGTLRGPPGRFYNESLRCRSSLALFGPSLRDTSYAYSRKTIVEVSLNMWSAINFTTALPAQDDFGRLAVNGSCFLHTSLVQAICTCAVELRTQILNEPFFGLGMNPFLSSLSSVVTEAKAWTLQCIKSGETSMKGHLLICLVAAQIDCLKRGCDKETTAKALVKEAEEAEETSRNILQRVARLEDVEEDSMTICYDDVDQINDMSSWLGNWDFSMPEVPFDLNAESMSWNQATL